MPRAVVTILVRGGRGALAQLQGVTREVRTVAQAEARAQASHARLAKSHATSAAEKASMLREQAKRATEQRRQVTAANEKAEQERRAQLEHTDKAFTAAEKRKAKAAEDAAKREAKAAEKAARAAEAAAKRAAREQGREAKRLVREQERAAQKALRAREKAERDAARSAQREAAKRERIEQQSLASRQKRISGMIRKGGGITGSVATGAVAGGLSAMGSARGVLGVQDAATRVQNANLFKENLIRLTHEAGMGERTGEVEQRILETAQARGKDPLEILQGLQEAHARFNMLDMFVENMDEVSKASKATGAEFQDLVGMMGAISSAFQLSGDEFSEALAIVSASASTGSVEMKDFSRDFAASAGLFAGNTGQLGIAGVKHFAATAQTIATGQFGSAESSTRLERLITDLNDVDVRKGLQKIGVELPKEGVPIDVGNIIEQLSSNEKFAKASVRQDIFKEVRALQAVEAMIRANKAVSAGQKGAVDYASIFYTDETKGRQDIDEKFQALEDSGLIELQRQAIEMQNNTIQNLERYNEQILAVAKASNILEQEFGTLAMWAKDIGIGGMTAGGAGMLGGLIGRLGLGGATAAAGAGTAAAGGAAVAAGGGALAAAMPIILGTIAAGVAAWGVNKAVEMGTGESLVDKVQRWFSDDEEKTSKDERSREPPAQESSSTEQAKKPSREDAQPVIPEGIDYRDHALRVSHDIANIAPSRDKTASEKAAEEKPSKVDLRVDLHQYDHRTQVKTSVKSPSNVNVSTLSGPTPFGGL